MKSRVYVWGAGDYLQNVLDILDMQKIDFKGILDINPQKIGTLYDDKYRISSIKDIRDEQFDYIVCTVKNIMVMERNRIELNLPRNKVLFFWNNEFDADIFDEKSVTIELLKRENKSLKSRLENAPYEYGYYKTPKLCDNDVVFADIIIHGKSLARFGDGEFEMMRGASRPWFQTPNKLLSQKLKEVITENDDRVIIGIANNFGNLDKYTDQCAADIRDYLTLETRKDIMSYLDMNREYADAYLTRPYIIYKDKDGAKYIFDQFKRVWKDRNILIVEGKYSRMGVKNDLFSECKSVRRILCPEKNVFDIYGKLKEKIIEMYEKNDLILISLGPTATVLTYELAKEGIQTIDIGQIDNEYEWYLRGVVTRTEIQGKSVSELSWCRAPEDIEDELYEAQVICRMY